MQGRRLFALTARRACSVQYGQSLETNTFHDSTADFVWFFFVCMGVCLVSASAHGYLCAM